ncbi:methyltransferase [Bordetella genomosp. 8]|uniref:Methyltransferase n=1 Tax=Bordetella genomosp. 8 TaxID=1416806 RepID=A0A1W6YKA9_9BORD|nr:class I SAM-dependent methyltransferase [Bordetella genomosp. 8]ARP81409.1 methyltransferase [Bordetella genomosp. 8]
MHIATCPLCGTPASPPFVSRPDVPCHQHLVYETAEEARRIARGRLDMAACPSCGFVFNRSFDPARLSYGQSYDNAQSHSAHFDAYLDGLAGMLVRDRQVRDCTIVEVGCGKGEFLRKLVGDAGAGNRGIGFDPSYIGPETELDGRLSFRKSYYDASCAAVPADVVICRHVIEHIQTPLDLLHSVRAALSQARNARVFFETPAVEWILRGQVIWDFFYEHCSLFSATSIRAAFQRTGFRVEDVHYIFGEQYLWVEATPTEPATGAVPPADAAELVALTQAYADAEARLIGHLKAQLDDACGRKKIAVWGAGAKGVTLANLLDPDGTRIDCVIDLNPNKQGRFVPGTGHPIVSPAQAARRGVEMAVLMNPNYRSENLKILAEQNIRMDLADWSKQ